MSVQPWLWSVSESDERVIREAALVRAAQAGDEAALDQLLALHERPLLLFCRGILGHAEDAEDAAQETLFRSLRGLPHLRPGPATFRTWLFKIALNVCRDRKRRRRPSETLDEEHPGLVGPEHGSPEAIALRRLQVAEALRALPSHRRAIFLLKVLEGWSVEEIGQVMGWNPKRVYNELYKSRCTLAEWRARTAEDEKP